MKTFSTLSIIGMTVLLAGCAATSSDTSHTTHSMDSMGTMTMDDMTSMLQGKEGDDFDKAFLEAMIPHHEGAVEMAKLALVHSKHAAIKTLAESILESQQREIDAMKEWQQAWGY